MNESIDLFIYINTVNLTEVVALEKYEIIFFFISVAMEMIL